MDVPISMKGQRDYIKAVVKYGEGFANAVVAEELQLYADNLDCFDEYAEYERMQEFIRPKPSSGLKNEEK